MKTVHGTVAGSSRAQDTSSCLFVPTFMFLMKTLICIAAHFFIQIHSRSIYFEIQGSITGASSALVEKEVVPSFILLAVQDTKVVCYVYELVNDEVQVSKTEFAKKASTSSSGGEPDSANAALMASLLS